MIKQNRLLNEILRALSMVVKHNDFLCRLQNGRAFHHTGAVRIHNNHQRFIIHFLQCILFLHKSSLIIFILRHLLENALNPCADLIHYNAAFFAHSSCNGTNPHARTKAVQIPIAVSHNHNRRGCAHQLPQSICLYARSDTPVSANLACLCAVEQVFFAFLNQHLIPAASQCKVKRCLRTLHGILQRAAANADPHTHRYRNMLANIDFANGIHNIKFLFL